MTESKLEKKVELVKLRAMGKSFQTIAKELQLSKQTVIKWASELNEEISNETFMEVQRLLELHNQSRIEKITMNLNQIRAINEAIEVKLGNPDGLSLSDLMKYREILIRELNNQLERTIYFTGETESLELDFGISKKILKIDE